MYMKSRAKNQFSNPSLAEVFSEQMCHLAKSHSLFTVENYRNVYRSVCEFVGTGADKFGLKDITGTWLNAYILHMKVGIYVRAVWIIIAASSVRSITKRWRRIPSLSGRSTLLRGFIFLCPIR